jgi:hypothetical protein
MNPQLPVSIGRNAGNPEYHFERQLSQLSDGLLDGSKRLALCGYSSRKLDQLLNQYFWQIIPSCIKQGFGEILP